MFIDTHCHIDSYERHAGESFNTLLERFRTSSFASVLSSAKEKAAASKITQPEAFIHVACDPADFDYARTLSEKYDNVYTAYGIHPEYVETETAEDEARMLEFLKHPKCVACGEFGLDYHYGAETKAAQVKLFERHLQLGIESGKPLVLHLREADDDALAVLRTASLHNRNVHVHCFTGTPEFVEQLLALDANIFVGFTGIVTFNNAQSVRDAAALVPLEQMLLETDSPYMAPVPFRGKPYHSGYIPFIADKLAEIKNVPVEDIYKHCRENTKKCYGV
ncbi:TatD family hydrolase [Fibrobacter sp.]|uniref:TatD family hydrolase n=1 Tax=Fibrobacter sp. TaxID=35828 RepID=UPI0025C5731E|nr:TatD family hydrolase [Fibrobacter sp.]MBR3071884.1 TatD family hydrolase [Fibrobacter sp.]